MRRREEKKASKAQGRTFCDQNRGKQNEQMCELNDSIAKTRGCRHASSTLFEGGYMWHAGAACCPSLALLWLVWLLLTQAMWCYSRWPASSLSWSPLSASPTRLKHLCQVASSWLLGVPGWSGGKTPLPRLCTPAGPLAQTNLLGGLVSCHISGPVSPVHT